MENIHIISKSCTVINELKRFYVLYIFTTECDTALVLKMSSIGSVAMVIAMVSILPTPSYGLSQEIPILKRAQPLSMSRGGIRDDSYDYAANKNVLW